MARLLTYKECDDLWRQEGRGRVGDRLAYYRALQDRSYRIPSPNNNFIDYFRTDFPDNENFKSGLIINLSNEEIHNSLDAEELYKKRVAVILEKQSGGRYSSLLEAYVRYAMRNHKVYVNEVKSGQRELLKKFHWLLDEEWTTQDWVTAISLDQQRGSKGLVEERRTQNSLCEAFTRFKGLSYREATDSEQVRDIDAVVEGPSGKEVVSIKSGWALSPDHIRRERQGVKKQSPTLYVGYKSVRDKKMTAFNADGSRVSFKEVVSRLGVR